MVQPCIDGIGCTMHRYYSGRCTSNASDVQGRSNGEEQAQRRREIDEQSLFSRVDVLYRKPSSLAGGGRRKRPGLMLADWTAQLRLTTRCGPTRHTHKAASTKAGPPEVSNGAGGAGVPANKDSHGTAEVIDGPSRVLALPIPLPLPTSTTSVDVIRSLYVVSALSCRI